MNILDFYKMNNFLNKHFGFTLPASIMVVAKCLKLIWNQSGIISRTYFSPFQGVYYLYRGLRRAPKPYFCLILEFWIIFLIFYEWIILLSILDSVEWIFWILVWIEFWIESFFGPIQWKNEFLKCIAHPYKIRKKELGHQFLYKRKNPKANSGQVCGWKQWDTGWVCTQPIYKRCWKCHAHGPVHCNVTIRCPYCGLLTLEESFRMHT